MTEFTETAEQLINAISTYNDALEGSKELSKRLSNNVSWYFTEAHGNFIYGPSKWVGYKDLDAETYIALTDGGELGGQLTEASLVPLRREVAQKSSEHHRHYERLQAMLAPYNKTPNKRVRFNEVLNDKITEIEVIDKEANLVALLSAVIRTLPASSIAQLKREFFQ